MKVNSVYLLAAFMAVGAALAAASFVLALRNHGQIEQLKSTTLHVDDTLRQYDGFRIAVESSLSEIKAKLAEISRAEK